MKDSDAALLRIAVANNNQATPILYGERLVLRPPLERDMQDRLSFGRNAEFHKMVGGDARDFAPLTEEGANRWYETVSTEPLNWIIEADGRCIGTARLHSFDEENRRARYAIGIFTPEYWSRGYGSEATRLVLKYAFEELRLHRVDLRVLEFNHRAIASYEKCGFKREGIEREGALIGGEWQSDVWMSILEHEYRRNS